MATIEVAGLTRHYRVYRKREGLRASLRGLWRRRYETVRAVEDVSFQIEEGELVGFLGPNGAGKTTTLKMLSGLLVPTAGAARVMGFVPWERANDYRRSFSLVMGQKNQLWWDLPAQESFRLHRDMYAIPEPQYRRTLGELSELLGIGNLAAQPVRELSLGERMKMELIAALLHSPRVVFLDEPTIGLDVVAQASLQQCLRDYNRRHGVTMILTSHYMKDVEALCRRILVINRGRLVYDGALQGILQEFSRHKVVRLETPHGAECPAAEWWARFGAVQEYRPPVITLRVERTKVPEALAQLLAERAVVDVTVEEAPLEEVIAQVFSATAAGGSP